MHSLYVTLLSSGCENYNGPSINSAFKQAERKNKVQVCRVKAHLYWFCFHWGLRKEERDIQPLSKAKCMSPLPLFVLKMNTIFSHNELILLPEILSVFLFFFFFTSRFGHVRVCIKCTVQAMQNREDFFLGGGMRW